MLSKVSLELDEYLWAQWECTRLAFISAPLGFGKSEFAHRMLHGLDVLEVDAEETDVTEAITAESIEGHDAVLVDNVHDAVTTAQGPVLASLAARATDTRFVFISRAPMPGWLTPIFARGELLIVTSDDLLFTDNDIAHLLVANSLSPAPEYVEHIAEISKRYPLAVSLAVTHMQRDESGTWEQGLSDEIMCYFETEFEHRFDARTQEALLLVSLFDKVDDRLVLKVLGEKEGKDFLDALRHATCFVAHDTKGWYVRQGLRQFCAWERRRKGMAEEYERAITRAIDCYAEEGDHMSALDLCARCGRKEKMLDILKEHARLHPGNGSFFELERYYHELPDSIVRDSARLMRVMSMLDSLSMDIMESERWYEELETYAEAPGHTKEERDKARSYLAYLDLALPHRRLSSIVDAVKALALINASDDPDLQLSITSGMPSVINGGRDLSAWVPADDATCLAMSKIASKALGRQGTGTVEIALCESKFEKGADVTPYIARVNALLPQIRRKGDPSIEFAAIGIQCRALMEQGDARQALVLLDPLRRRMVEHDTPESRRILRNLDALRCHAWMRLGETERVHAWLEENAPDISRRLNFLDRYIYLTVCQAYFSESRYAEAYRLMATLSGYVQSRDITIYVIHYDILSAIAAWRQGRSEWQTWLERALEKAKKYGYVRTITEYGPAVLPLLLEEQKQLLERGEDAEQLGRLIRGARLQASHYPNYLAQAQGPAEPLTDTERQVLRLICQNKSNAEIGELLGVKLPTVKTHVSHIFTKLGVSRRAQAASEAKRLRLA
jgi:LuxR family maltose regulon positive regulatory protein